MKRIRRNVWSYETLGTEREPRNAASQCSQGRPKCLAHTSRPSGALRSRAYWPKRNSGLDWQRLGGTEGPSRDTRRAGMRHSPCSSAGTLASGVHVQAAAGVAGVGAFGSQVLQEPSPENCKLAARTHESVEL